MILLCYLPLDNVEIESDDTESAKGDVVVTPLPVFSVGDNTESFAVLIIVKFMYQ